MTDLSTLVRQADPVPTASDIPPDEYATALSAIETALEEHLERQSAWRHIWQLRRRPAVVIAAAVVLTALVVAVPVLILPQAGDDAADTTAAPTTTATTSPPTTSVPTTTVDTTTTVPTTTTITPTTTTVGPPTNPTIDLARNEFAVFEQQAIDGIERRWMVVMRNPFEDRAFEDVRFDIELFDADGAVTESIVQTTHFILPKQEILLTGTIPIDHEVIDTTVTPTGVGIDVSEDVAEGRIGPWAVTDVVYDSRAAGSAWAFEGNLTQNLEAINTMISVHVVMRDETGAPISIALGQVSYIGPYDTVAWVAPTPIHMEFESFDTYVKVNP